MKRSAYLQPLSREHHNALKLAKTCERCADTSDESILNMTCIKAVKLYDDELEAHFRYEENNLLPLLMGTSEQPMAERVVHEHKMMQSMLNELRLNHAHELRRFGEMLAEHVRYEERELFPVLEQFFSGKTKSD